MVYTSIAATQHMYMQHSHSTAVLSRPRVAALSPDSFLQVALIQSMLQPATRTSAQAATQADAAASSADAAGRPEKDDALREVVQVATVDSFQVTCQSENQPVSEVNF